MSAAYPEHAAVLKAIAAVEFAKENLEASVKSYKAAASGAKGKSVVNKATELEATQIALSAHIPKMLAVGDRTSSLVEKTMACNDSAQAYSNQVRRTICPELFEGGGSSVGAPAPVPQTSGSADGDFTITIKTMTQNNVPVRVTPSDTIAECKRKYQDKSGTPPDQQRLILKGTELDDGRTLSDYGIGDGAILHVVLRLRQPVTVSKKTEAELASPRSSACCVVQ